MTDEGSTAWKRGNWVPAPQAYLLNLLCVGINDSLGDYGCYLVGSALHTRDYRDVDVRFIMKDEQYDVWFGTQRPAHTNALWTLLCTSISLFLQKHTGLPVDFQIQRMTQANLENEGHERHPLGSFVKPTPRDYAAELASEKRKELGNKSDGEPHMPDITESDATELWVPTQFQRVRITELHPMSNSNLRRYSVGDIHPVWECRTGNDGEFKQWLNMTFIGQPAGSVVWCRVEPAGL